MKFCFSSLLAAGLFLIYRLIRRTLAPLNGLAGQIRGRRTEEPERPLAVPDSGDEVAEMARAFTQMSGQLNQVFVMQKTSPVSSSLLFPPSEGRYHGNGAMERAEYPSICVNKAETSQAVSLRLVPFDWL